MSPDIISKDKELSKEIQSQVLDLRKKYGFATEGNGSEGKATKPVEAKKTATQPTGSKVFSGLSAANSRYYATNQQLKSNSAHVKDILRELDKTDSKLKHIEFKTVETPGVIPRTLSEVEAIVTRINKEEQPRIEKILDTTNGNLSETQQLLQKINVVMGDPDKGGLLHALKKYDLFFKIGLGLAGFSILVTIVLIPWVLLRIIFFGL